MHNTIGNIAFRILLIMLMCHGFSHGQSDLIKDLEADLKQLEGGSYISKSFNLSKEYVSMGYYDNALKTLELAGKEARSIGDRGIKAAVYTGTAKIILESFPNRRSYLLKALKAIESSLDTGVSDLYNDNSELLQVLISKSQDTGLNRRAEKAIEEINNRKEKIEKEEEDEQIEKEYKDFKKQGKEAFIDVKKEAEFLEEVVVDLAMERKNLVELNKEREEQINKMSELQAKSELILNQKQMINDSLEQKSLQDSLEKMVQQQAIDYHAAESSRLKSELELGKTRTKLSVAVLAIVALVSLFLFLNWKSTKEHNLELESQKKIIESEKQKSEKLLLNILPEKIAHELKDKGNVQTKFYDISSVLFADFVNFSKISKTLSPKELIDDLHFCFSEFDKIIAKHKVEKIKTIGDAYMCAAGVPEPMENHADVLVKTAFEMQAFLKRWNKERTKNGLPEFNARIGIHSGAVIGGVVGSSKFAFDIWGDTVNTAGRMETTSESGKINISSVTKELLKGDYILTSRGKISVKNMDDMQAYFIDEI